MKQILSDDDRSRLDHMVKETERRTGAEIVLSVVRRSDVYAEIPWKAFATAASLAAVTFIVITLLRYRWASQYDVLIAMAVTLGAGALAALTTVFIPAVARLLLSDHRAEEEVHQYASSLFIEKELFATAGRTGILILVSLFERKVVIMPDTGTGRRVTQADLQRVITPMISYLRHRELKSAFEEGLNMLALVVAGETSSGKDINELPDNIIEEDGE